MICWRSNSGMGKLRKDEWMSEISELPEATLPLTGAEIVVLVQNGVTVQAPINTTTILASYTVTTLPSPSVAGTLIYVSNESGGAVPAFSDGLAWRRVTDRAVVS